MSKEDGGSAFPFHREWENERKGYTESESSDGMSLRDYFAAAALQGQLAGSVATQQRMAIETDPAKAAEWAYQYADAMLKARLLEIRANDRADVLRGPPALLPLP